MAAVSRTKRRPDNPARYTERDAFADVVSAIAERSVGGIALASVPGVVALGESDGSVGEDGSSEWREEESGTPPNRGE
jgi:hypothetical protein